MSSPLAHIAAGTAIYFCQSRLRAQHARWALPLFVFLAVLPDFDYLAIWFFRIRQEIRISHTLAFCLLAGLLAWAATSRLRAQSVGERPFSLGFFLMAPVSHLLLDLAVEARSLPVFWPLPFQDIASPVGLLPGVIHVRSFTNFYLWRNFIVETVILVPALLAAVAMRRASPLRQMLPPSLWIAPVWLASLVWCLCLPR